MLCRYYRIFPWTGKGKGCPKPVRGNAERFGGDLAADADPPAGHFRDVGQALVGGHVVLPTGAGAKIGHVRRGAGRRRGRQSRVFCRSISRASSLLCHGAFPGGAAPAVRLSHGGRKDRPLGRACQPEFDHRTAGGFLVCRYLSPAFRARGSLVEPHRSNHWWWRDLATTETFRNSSLTPGDTDCRSRWGGH